MKLPGSAHFDRPWRIHAIAPDFGLEDVWALPTPGGPGDFRRLVELGTALDPGDSSAVVRALFALRWKLGDLLGLDGDGSGLGRRVSPVAARLPADLRGTADDARFGDLPFTPLYLTDDEFAAEIANRTVHGILHLGWVEDGSGGYRGQMAVLVKRNGLLGAAYMAAITPFRHLLVYPTLTREFGRAWQTG